ncbi:hypothetical protein SAMN05216532_2682 [Streptomyces sp. 2231.1]|nr:hypothetical protein SAMN05216532_2682 [Streptomyces sp. 2231.1]
MLWARSRALMTATSAGAPAQTPANGHPMATASDGHHAFSQTVTASGRFGPPTSSLLNTPTVVR